ncbi:MAG: FAD-dependent thymidylate synthase [Ruminococcaceae bacterium]|nr:FAD-dependent thymidylate synthase [Oscillospiraceae bacterium]
MNIIKPSFLFNDEFNGNTIIKKIEKAARVCYKSEDKITEKSAETFLKNIINQGHESVLEHEKITVTVICDRGVSHEIVRHRIASYSQESTRYCNYSNSKFGKELTFIKPCFWDENSDQYLIWIKQMQQIEDNYIQLIRSGSSPQEARAILPNSLKTEIVITMNIREWRHFFKLRTSHAAHPQMREIAQLMLSSFQEKIPVLFDDILQDK